MIKHVVTAALLSLSLVTVGCGDTDDGGSGGSKPAPTDETKDEGKKPAAQKPTEKKPAAQKPSAKKPAAKKPAGEDEKPEQPVDDRSECEIAWDDYQDYNEVGDFLKYKTVTVSNFGGFGSETESLMRQEVIANDGDSVTWKYTTETNGQSFDSESEIQKVTFIEGCEFGDAEDPEDEGEETVEVEAGSFDTHWVRYRRAIDNGESVATTYSHELTSGDTIVIKSLTETIMDNGDMTSTMELIETNKE